MYWGLDILQFASPQTEMVVRWQMENVEKESVVK